MGSFAPLLRIAFGLAALTCSILIGLDLLGFVPEESHRIAEERIRTSEMLVTQATVAIDRGDLSGLRPTVEVLIRRDEELLSAGLRESNGKLLFATREHRKRWKPLPQGRSTATQLQSPIYRDGKRWAQLELTFAELQSDDVWLAFLRRPIMRLVTALGVIGFVAYLVFMRRTLRHLDPSAVIPPRVQTTLDVMAEGVLLIDSDDQIILANKAFCSQIGRKQSALIGLSASRLGWLDRHLDSKPTSLPWMRAAADAQAILDQPLRLEHKGGDPKLLVVNSSPVLDGKGVAKGVIATFADVTALEKSRAELEQALAELEKSRDEVRLQNEELELLATTDPLTGATNRRAFMDWFEPHFEDAKLRGTPMACGMVDIDHFKRVNDDHGHAMGDEIIRRVADILMASVRSVDMVCRYGGEEFCVVFPGLTAQEAETEMEMIRVQIASPGFARLEITASFGVSAMSFTPGAPMDLVDQADQALYAAKTGGRNQVRIYDPSLAAEEPSD